jgi:Rap/ran-GAP
MDDIAAINFHVATMMPNIGDNTTKKGPIGNDAVKIVWNDGGRPYDFATFRSAFNLINIVIEPQSLALTLAYKTSLDGFLKVTMQTAPGVPRVTPIGDFKMVRLEYLPVMMRHFSIFACLFCESWMNTGGDGTERTPLETNWKGRLACIERSEKYLKPERV